MRAWKGSGFRVQVIALDRQFNGQIAQGQIERLRDDSQLNLAELKRLLERVRKSIHGAPNDVRYAMNSLVICVGSYVKDLTGLAKEVGEKIGPVEVDTGNSACQVPFAPDYIRKVEKRGTIGKKRKTAKC